MKKNNIMIRKRFVLIILFVAFTAISCNSTLQSNNETKRNDPILKLDSLKTSFKDFYSSIQILESGFTLIDGGAINFQEIESPFVPDGASLIGRLKNNKIGFPIIYAYPADIVIPILELYNSEGEKINQFELFDLQYCSNIEIPQQHCEFKVIDDSTIVLSNFSLDEFQTRRTKSTDTLRL